MPGSALLNCHVLKGFGIYMIGILDSLSDVWKGSLGTPPRKQGLGVSLFIFSLASHTAGVLTVTTHRNSIIFHCFFLYGCI